MKLQTIIKTEKSNVQIDYDSGIMLIGSCFTDNIGNILSALRFDTTINPCGIVYNPESVATSLDLIMDNKVFTKDDLLKVGEQWVSLKHHGSFSSKDYNLCLKKINDNISLASKKILSSKFLIITLGTSWVYRYSETGEIVSNCHKIPASKFERFRLDTDEIVIKYTTLIKKLRNINKDIKIIFTVSPIRHWKDGAHGNQLSKSVLLLAIDKLKDLFNNIYYFCAYELMMDELRDYRFYSDDMLHPSKLAVEYIWDRFKQDFISPSCFDLMKFIEKLNKKEAHRPTNVDSEEYKRFAQKLISDEKYVQSILKRK